MHVALVLTHACNLACTYCYAGEKKRVRMDMEVASRALGFAFERAESRGTPLTLAFFGGEPLLEWERLVTLARAARATSSAVPLMLQVTTNGTLLDEEKVSVLADLGVHVAISIDGTARAQDAARPSRAAAARTRPCDARWTRCCDRGGRSMSSRWSIPRPSTS